jgi:deferrochelatase/peroxidase EfeB
VRLASPHLNEGARLLRRGYSYDDGPGEAGLLLLLYQADPRRQFVPIQRRLAAGDALNRFAETVGSGLFAIPPGTSPGRPLADALFS